MVVAHLTPEEEAAAVEEAERLLAQIDSFAEFAQAFWPIAQTGRRVIWGWHLQYVCDRVQEYVERGYGTLVVCLPFRSGKSTLLNKLLNAWDWLHRPNRQYINISKDPKNASRDSRGTRKIISSPEYQRLARIAGVDHLVVLERDQNEKINFATAGGGGRRCTTTLGSITGGDGDVLIIDDPVDAKEVELGTASQVAKRMQAVEDLYDNSWTDRMNPNPDLAEDVEPGVRIIIAQRVHVRDLPGIMIERRDKGIEDVEVIVIPEEYDPDPPGGVCPADPRTEPGELLQADLRGRGFVDAIRRRPGGERKVATRLNQRPTVKEGTKFRRSWMTNRYRDDPVALACIMDRVVIAADLNLKGEDDNDPISIQVWGRRDARFYLLHNEHGRMSYKASKAAFRDVCTRFPMAVTKKVEGAANGFALVSDLQDDVPGITTISPKGMNKEARAKLVTGVYEAMQVWLPESAPWVQAWVEEVCNFPDWPNDDQVDAMVYALWILLGLTEDDEATTAEDDYFAALGL